MNLFKPPKTLLFKIKDSIDKQLLSSDRQILVNECNSISISLNGDGNGLLGGSLIEKVIKEFLVTKINNFKSYNFKESDFMIDDTPFSFKKISGKSVIALDWSKNKVNDRTYFTSDIIIYVMKTSRWWLKTIGYDNIVHNGFYFIDKNNCKDINLLKNNKTNALISTKDVYNLLIKAKTDNLFIELPEPDTVYEFNLRNAFIKK
jgi:hypothetical protein